MNRRHFIGSVAAGTLTSLVQGAPGLAEAQAVPGRREDSPIGHADPWLEVNLENIRWNFSRVKNLVKVPVMAVVKANAYGHGLVPVSKTLERAGADRLMTGKLQEAVRLREEGIRIPILNFGPFDGRDAAEIVSRNISQSVYTDEALILEEAAARLGKKASVHIDIDTGMGRTGVSLGEALSLLIKISGRTNIRIDGVSTTLTEEPEFDLEQVQRFQAVCEEAKNKGISIGIKHAASSAGIFQSPRLFLDMVRPGITLYGYYPNARTRREDALALKPALRFEARVIFIKDLRPGETLSYLRVFKAPAPMRVATVGAGYSDGYNPLLGSKAHVLIRDRTFAVLNAVTSNHVMIDLGEDREVRVGDEVTLIDDRKSSGLTTDALAEAGGISDYKLLIGLNPLLPRRYTNSSVT